MTNLSAFAAFHSLEGIAASNRGNIHPSQPRICDGQKVLVCRVKRLEQFSTRDGLIDRKLSAPARRPTRYFRSCTGLQVRNRQPGKICRPSRSAPRPGEEGRFVGQGGLQTRLPDRESL